MKDFVLVENLNQKFRKRCPHCRKLISISIAALRDRQDQAAVVFPIIEKGKQSQPSVAFIRGKYYSEEP